MKQNLISCFKFFFISINSDHIKTFKITATHEAWRFHSQEGLYEEFSSLTELAMSIDTAGHRKCWLEPSAYGKCKKIHIKIFFKK